MHNQELRVSTAKYITTDIISDPTNKISLKLHSFDSLIEISKKLLPFDDMRFIIREAIVHIQIMKQRVIELKLVSDQVVTKIGPLYNPATNSIQEQEIICSFNEGCITTVLRLTPDCPLPTTKRKHSGSSSCYGCGCYIEQIIGFGWTNKNTKEYLDRIKRHVNNNVFATPSDAVLFVKNEILKIKSLQEHNDKSNANNEDAITKDNDIMPRTPPALPLMNKIMSALQQKGSRKK